MRRKVNDRYEVPVSLGSDELCTLLDYVRGKGDTARQGGGTRAIIDELIILLLIHAGLRAEELCVLRLADTPACHGKPQVRVHHGTKSGRIVGIPAGLAQVIQRFVRLHRKDAKPDAPLLLSERGTRFSYMSLYSKVRRIGQEAGVGKLHPGMLRRTFLVRLYEKEQDLRLVQEQAGHASLKTTAFQVRPRRRCEACNKRVASGNGRVIDSGQLLCRDCLRELRNHS